MKIIKAIFCATLMTLGFIVLIVIGLPALMFMATGIITIPILWSFPAATANDNYIRIALTILYIVGWIVILTFYILGGKNNGGNKGGDNAPTDEGPVPTNRLLKPNDFVNN